MACADPAGLTHGTAAITISGGEAQSGPLGRALPDSIAVTVTDFAGHPVPRVPVQWSTSDGTIGWGGVTDAAGHARAAWMLGLSPGDQHARATVIGLDPVEFSATGTGLQAQQLAGGYHVCALTGDHALYCWSRDPADTPLPLDTVPTRVDAGLAFTQVAAGLAHTCGLVEGGALYCWGQNSDGQLGDGTYLPRTTPTLVRGGPYTAVFAGVSADATCAIDPTGQAWCWGYLINAGPGLARASLPVAIGGPAFRSLSVGTDHICGVAVGGGAWCWGRADDGELGIGPTSQRWVSVPGPVPGPQFSRVGAGAVHSCGVASYRIQCWGVNLFGALGAATPGGRSFSPAPVTAAAAFVDLSLGTNGSYALDAGGVGYSWGSPGCCDLPGSAIPIPLPGAVTLDTLVATGRGACGLTAGTHYVICWSPEGENYRLRPSAPPAIVSPAPPEPSTRAAPERTHPAFPSRPQK